MKQFNLDEYLKNPSRKVVTSGGKSVRIICTDRRNKIYPIVALVEDECNEKICSYSKDGRLFYGELSSYDLFFPEKETEEYIITCDNIPLHWSWGKLNVEKFDVNTLQPFDKVLVRNDSTDPWRTNIFGYINKYPGNNYIDCAGFLWNCCIPYNEETQHLVGTSNDCPEYYKWWEE